MRPSSDELIASTGALGAPLDRLLWLADRVQAQHSWLWPETSNTYDAEHDRSTCVDPDHFGCHIVSLVEGVRTAAADCARLRDALAGQGCIGCKARTVVGFTIDREPGPFCHDCWSALKMHVAQVNLLNHHVDARDRDVELPALPAAPQEPGK